MFEYDNIIDFLSAQIDIIFVTKLRRNGLRLTPSLKLFFCFNILLDLKEIDISSIDASEKLRDMMGCHDRAKIYLYRNKLRNLGYFVTDSNTKGGYSIHPLFRFKTFDDLISPKTYKFTIKCTEVNLNSYC